jgi:hypothetical protein
MTEDKKEIKEIRKLKETVEGMQSVAYDAMERMSFQGGQIRAGAAKTKKKSTDKD